MSTNAPEKIAGVALAAGAGSRFGFKPKCLLGRDGEPLIVRQIRLLREAGITDVVVVLGHHAERVAAVLAELKQQKQYTGLHWTLNPAPDEGTAGSLRRALNALPQEVSGVMVLLGDQPLLQAGDVRALRDAWTQRAPGIALVLPQHQGQPGHPLIFDAQVRQAVAAMQGADGVRHWRRAHPEAVQAIAVTHDRCTRDVDTEADVQALAHTHGVRLQWPAALA